MALQATAYVVPARPEWPSRRLFAGVRVRLAASRLNARLAAGEPPWIDADLARRARQLSSMRARRGVAAGLERLWTRAAQPGIRSAAIRFDPVAAHIARPALEQLAAALRARESVDPRGVILARQLLTEPDSALYRPSYAEELYEAAREALLALG
jgi:hypothetical protein